MRYIFLAGLLSILYQLSLAKQAPLPFVVLPPFLRNNASNTITITPVKLSSENVDMELSVHGIRASKSSVIFSQKIKAKKAGSPHSISFDIKLPVDSAKISLSVQGHAKFECELPVKEDLAALHIHTDKNIYRAGETVNVRGLPLTYSGSIYQGEIELVLVNPDSFELVRKISSSSDSFFSSSFLLPSHLFFGDWKIVARPKQSRDSQMTWDTAFTVSEYALPPFKIVASIAEGQPLDYTRIDVDARYFHGSTISGTLSIFCSPTKKNQTSKSLLVLQSQVGEHLREQREQL